MRNSVRLHLGLIILSTFLLLLCPASVSAGSDYDYGAHPRFMCTPIPADADPACFPAGGQSVGGPGPGGSGHHGSTAGGGPPTGWWGMTEEAKATILHLRESLVRQKETILDQRETIRELTAKLTLCEGFGHSATAHGDDHRGAGHNTHSNNGQYINQLGHHGNNNNNPLPEMPHYPSVGGHRSDGGGHSNHHKGKDKHTVAGDVTSSPEQMERMLQALKERLENLQKRNSSTTYSSSLKELLQRKITALEQQLQHHTAALSDPYHHDNDSSHHHDDDDDDNDDDDDDDDDAHHAERPRNDHHDNDGRETHREDPGDGHDDDGHRDADGDHSDGHHDSGHHNNEAVGQGYVPRTGYHWAQGPRSGPHTTKLETMLNQLHLAGTGSSSKKAKSPDTFQIGFPMRTNYMYGKLKRTLLHDIFAMTLCLWIKGGVGPGLGTPFSYSVPGQANELVLIEWGNNPMELLIDDKAVTLPLSLSDGKWHHVCVTWSTRDGQWEAFQDGVQRGSGENLSAWHPIKAGGIFILGQEQDTLGGRFDATQSFVGEISDLQMWSHVLTPSDIYSLASCGSHLSGDVVAWSESEVELHGGVTKYPFDPCH